MKEVLRKKAANVSNVTYQDGVYSHNLRASNYAVEVKDHRMTLSFELSPESKTSNAYLDTKELKRKFDSIKFVQMRRDSWLEEGLRSALREAQKPVALELKFTFDDGIVRTMPASLQAHERHFSFNRKSETGSEEVSAS